MKFLLLILLLTGCATTDSPQQWEKKCVPQATPPFEKCYDVPVKPPREPREHHGRF